jgi:peroxiredoxin
MSLNTGIQAPNFTLKSFTPSDEAVDISLSSFKGKNLIILFFPMAFTGVCTEEMCTMSDNFSSYKSLNADVIGISVDGTFVQRNFAKQNNISIPLLSDFNKEVIKLYDVYLPEFAHGMKGTAQRAVFLIDKEGIIRYTEVTKSPGDQINFDALKNALSSLS